jgi:anti-sigma regulatory factor (Ser/Thr protein kinase)
VAAERTDELTLPGSPDSVPAARRFVRRTLAAWGLAPLADAASLVVSELATNAVLHARSEFTVRVAVDEAGGLRLEVADRSRRRLQPRSHSAAATTGRGLGIVGELAQAWGVADDEHGKSVWVVLRDVQARQVLAPGGGAASGAGRRRRSRPTGPTARAA